MTCSRCGRQNDDVIILGRCLHFDEEDFGTWYTDMVDAHRILTTAPDSPWLDIPFR